MDLRTLREKTVQELEMELENQRESLFRLRFRKVTDVVESPSQFQTHRKTIARIMTIINERKLEKGR